MTIWSVCLAGMCCLAVLIPAQPASACSCAPVQVCSAFWYADRVFTGRAEVTSLGPGAQRTRFRIEESFRGDAGAIEIESRGIGGSCDYGFVDGTRYLVYARRAPDGTWKAGLCSRTTSLDSANEDLAFARGVPSDPRRGGSVSGTVVVGEPDQNGRIVGSSTLSGVTITLRSDTHVVSAETNFRGHYEFNALPPARYTLTVRLSPRFEPIPPATVTVNGPGACASHGITAVRNS